MKKTGASEGLKPEISFCYSAIKSFAVRIIPFGILLFYSNAIMSKADQTKQFIIEKTAPVFNVKGYAGTSLSDITTATGLTKGSIYGNFTNKDEVALAAFDHNLKIVQGIVKKEMSKCVSTKEKLLAYVTIYKDFASRPFPEGGCPILNTAIEADDTHPMLKKKASDAVISWKNSIGMLLGKAIENGELSADNDPEQIALSMIAMIEGGIMIAKVTGKLNYRESILQSVQEMIERLQ